MFENMNIDVEELINACEQICQCLKTQVNNKTPEYDNNYHKNSVTANASNTTYECRKLELLQKEANLTDDINCVQNTIKDLEDQLTTNRNKLNDLETARNNVHKEWIKINNLTNNDNDVPSRPDIRTFFEKLWSRFYDRIHDTSIFNTYYKRFDNLVNARCELTELFNTYWNINDVVRFFDSPDALSLKKWHDYKKNLKKGH